MADINEKIGQAMRLRPTLVVGAGGTGYETVVRMKARFQESFPPELLQQVRYVCFDTDTNHPPVRNSLGEMVYMEPQIELFQIGGVPVKGIIDNQKNYPEIAHELELKKLPRLDLTKGAKQVRQLGRLAFFYHFQRIRKVFETALRDESRGFCALVGSTEAKAAITTFFFGMNAIKSGKSRPEG
ncbi:MAG: tubulin-like doman-containing protein, partial [Candidatus Promineifilaceae bacterium]